MKIKHWLVAGTLLASLIPSAWAQTYLFKFGTKMPLENTDDQVYAIMPPKIDFATLEYESDKKRFTLRGTGLKNFGPDTTQNLGPIYNFGVWKVAFDLIDDYTVHNRQMTAMAMNHSANMFIIPEPGSSVDNLNFFSQTIPFELNWINIGWQLTGGTNDRNFVRQDEFVSWTSPAFDPKSIKNWPSPKSIALKVSNVAPGLARQAWYSADSVEIVEPQCDGVPCSSIKPVRAAALAPASTSAPVSTVQTTAQVSAASPVAAKAVVPSSTPVPTSAAAPTSATTTSTQPTAKKRRFWSW